jgi:hypothetical protein
MTVIFKSSRTLNVLATLHNTDWVPTKGAKVTVSNLPRKVSDVYIDLDDSVVTVYLREW